MKKYLPFILIGVMLLLVTPFIVGAFFLSYNLEGHQEEVMQNKPGDQSHRSYAIDVTEKPMAKQITLNEPTTIKYRIKNDQGNIVTDFAIAHEKVMHFIVVRKDLTQFQHLHPDFNQETGEFRVAVAFPALGPYRFFADFTPGTDNPMQLPVTLENYLGALGHSVVLKAETLDYIHTHAGEQGDAMEHGEHGGHAMPPAQENKIDFSTTFPDAGIYRIFTQFQHQGNVLTTAYTVAVK